MTVYIGFIVGIVITACFYSVFTSRQKAHETTYRIKIKFAHGITTRLQLNESQYLQFREWENQPDGYFTIGDDAGDHVKLFREHVCSVEVKKR